MGDGEREDLEREVAGGPSWSHHQHLPLPHAGSPPYRREPHLHCFDKANFFAD